jgi:hypothetical protein
MGRVMDGTQLRFGTAETGAPVGRGEDLTQFSATRIEEMDT